MLSKTEKKANLKTSTWRLAFSSKLYVPKEETKEMET